MSKTTIIYNGVQIENDVDLVDCSLTDSNGGQQDYCRIAFANGGKIWNEWQPQYNDTVQVIKGNSDSGVMYVNSIDNDNSNYALTLLSTPTTAKKQKTRIWCNVKLSEVANDIGKSIGFHVRFFDFTDRQYKALTQINQTDIALLKEICEKEGYRVKVYNREIIVFSEIALRFSNETGEIIKPEDCTYYSFSDENTPLSSVTVKHYDYTSGLIEFTAVDDTVNGGNTTVIARVDNQAHAERLATSILTSNNNYIVCGTIRLKYADVFASGSVIHLDGFKGYNGKWYIYQSVFNLINEDCYFKIAKVKE